MYAMEREKRVSKGEIRPGKIHGLSEDHKVRILLWDNNAESSRETFDLLCQSTYQVSWVRSETGIVEALHSEGPHTDIILAEVNLLMANGWQTLRYITWHKELQHIPVIILTTRVQVSASISGVKLGALDHLLKPIQAEEISHLWMHMQKSE